MQLFFIFVVLDCLCIIGMVIGIGSDGAYSHHDETAVEKGKFSSQVNELQGETT
ncbi:unnamed protein product [marine sediment metagenome]|uniref:Uncharacterized protein n=1 Tax=marine sediment metagenome TaxID=412755 RepID=X1BYF7_9ZZZZ